MYSNMYVNPSNIENREGKLFINYDVIVKNIDSKSHAVNLKDSFIKVTNKNHPIKCQRFKENDVEFLMESGAQARIQCLAILTKAEFNRSDYQSIIEIPLDQDIAKFEYLLRAEDFQ